MKEDIQVVFHRDPAARNIWEVLLLSHRPFSVAQEAKGPRSVHQPSGSIPDRD
jgi:hypothetical protein